MATISRANLYHVPGKTWRAWSVQARGVFNLIFSTMRPNQSLFIHPKAQPHSKEQWSTVAWNAAWIAARAVDGDVMTGDTMLEGPVKEGEGFLRMSNGKEIGIVLPDSPSPVTIGGYVTHEGAERGVGPIRTGKYDTYKT